MPTVTLREITRDTVREVCRLKLKPGQENFVAPNALSLAEALFSPEAWYRAICADGHIVGFVMLWDDTQSPTPPEQPVVFLWRLMVAADHQGQGIGQAAMAQVLAHVRSRPGITCFRSSFVGGEGGPERFYRQLGFVPTGAVDEDGEFIIEYRLRPATGGG